MGLLGHGVGAVAAPRGVGPRRHARTLRRVLTAEDVEPGVVPGRRTRARRRAEGIGRGVSSQVRRDGRVSLPVDDAGLLDLDGARRALGRRPVASGSAVGSGSGVLDSSLMDLIVPNGRW